MESVPCNLCGGGNARLLFKGKDVSYPSDELFSVVQCQKCKLAYLNPRPTRSEIGKYYPDDYYPKFTPSKKKNIVQKIRHQIMVNYYGYGKSNIFSRIVFYPFYLARHLFLNKGIAVPFVKGGKLLEIGFGDGSLMYEYRTYGWDVYGTDISKFAVQQASKLGLKVKQGELKKQKFKSDFFDAVVMSHVLEHVHDPNSELSEIRRILRKGGVAVIVLPNFDSVESKLMGDRWVAGLQIPRHLYHFSPRTLSALGKKAGFSSSTVSFLADQTTFIAGVERLISKSGKVKLFNKFFIALSLPVTMFLSTIRTSGIFSIYMRK